MRAVAAARSKGPGRAGRSFRGISITWSETLLTHRVALGQDRNDDAVAGLYLDDVRMRFFVTQLAARVAVFSCVDDDDRQFFIDQSVRAVLHLAGRIAFGVDVADLF